MNHEFIFSVLAIISALTTLTVEGIKKILNEKEINYSANILAVIVSAVLTLALCIGYVLYNGIGFSIQMVITMIALVYLSFLVATVGFDKIKQAADQLRA